MRETNKKFKRFLAMFLAVVMVVCNSNYAFAVDNTVEDNTENQTENIQEIIPETTPEAVEPAAIEPEPAAEPQPAAIEAEPAAVAAEQGNGAAPAETKSEEKAEPAAVVYPAFETQKVFEDQTVVTISAKEGVLPEGTTAEIKELDYEDDLQDVLDTAFAEKSAASVDAKMVDVVLKDKDGNVIQPNGKVEITISKMKLDIPEDYKNLVSYNAYRINADETLSLLKENVDITKDEVKFENDHFTAVGIVAETSALYEDGEMLSVGENLSGYSAIQEKNSKAGSGYNKLYMKYPDGNQYIAYCYNASMGWPPSGNVYSYGVFDADANEFYKSATEGKTYTGGRSDLPFTTDAALLRRAVMWTVYAGYPYNGSGEDFYGELAQTQKVALNSQEADDYFRACTQEVIWSFADYYEYGSGDTSLHATKYNRLYAPTAKKIREFALAKAQAGEEPPIKLDIFKMSENEGSMQNLLTTRLTKDVVVPSNPETSIDVPVYKYEKHQKVDGTWVYSKMPISGIEFTLTKAGDTSFTKTSKTNAAGTVTFTELEAGTYTITEKAAAGWNGVPNNTIKFTVDANGKITDANTASHAQYYEVNTTQKEIYIYNGHNPITFNKSAEDGSALEGAQFHLYWISEASGNATDNTNNRNAIQNACRENTYTAFNRATYAYNWKTYDDDRSESGVWTTVEGGQVMTLPDGVYRLAEEIPAEGYDSIGDVGFILKTENGVQKIYVYQDEENGGYVKLPVNSNVITNQIVDIIDLAEKQSIEISKVDVGGNELEGAEIQILDADYNIVEEYTTDGSPRKIELRPGIYTFVEKEAPLGYYKVESFEFEVDDKGNVNVLDQNIQFATAQDNYLVVTDQAMTTIVAGRKYWQDNNDQDGKRPEEITVILLQNNIPIKEQTVKEDKNGNWEYSFENLSEYTNGIKNVYSVKEKESTIPKGYVSTVKNYDIINTYNPEKTNIQIKKVWEDNDNQDGIQPGTITVHLYADGEDTGKSVVITKTTKWEASFDDLDLMKDGEAIEYTIKEDEVDGYSTTIVEDNTAAKSNSKQFTITNTHKPELINISGKKIWNDNSNQDGKRPGEVVLILKKDGQEVQRQTVSAVAGNEWSYKFENLPKYEKGTEITYTVQEGEVPAGYQSSVNMFDITNTYTPGQVAVQVTKSWVDNKDQDGMRSKDITVHLYADGKDTGKDVILNEGNNWIGTFSNLDEYKNGVKIVYTVTEDKIAGYTTEIKQGADVNHYTIINSHVPSKIDINGSKTWNDNNNQDGKRPSYIIVDLLANGVPYAAQKITAKDNWSWSFKNMPEYQNGQKVTYTIQESNVPADYTSKIEGYNITNNYTPDTEDVQVTKVWNDNKNQDVIRPNDITVRLYADGAETGKKLVLNEGNNWSGAFEDLDKMKDGKKIVYTIQEDEVTGYTTQITSSDIDGKHFTITNSHTPEVTKVEGTKSWDDNDNQDGKRPESVEVILKKAGQVLQKKTVTEADGWKYTFENLPKYENVSGEKTLIRYTVQEGSVPNGYTSEVAGTNIINHYKPGKVAIQVAKSWMDNDNQDGIRPTSVTIHLWADYQDGNGAVDTGRTINLVGNGWIGNFDDLDQYKDGKEIIYSITEDAVNKYNTVITTGADKKHFTVTNLHTPEVTKVEGTKSWDDADDQDGKRPESVEIILKKAGQEIARQTVSAKTNWTYSFKNLPKYENNGTEIRYTVQEGNVPEGYQSIVNVANITNKYTPGQVAVQVAKSWIDNDNQDGIRPNEITVRLLADGKDTGKTVVLNKGNNWIADFNNLAEKRFGKKIVYTVQEDAVAGYTTTITNGADEKHFTITNTHTPEVTKVEGTKSWDDNDNQDGKRPESIEVLLKKGGQVYDRQIVSAATNWKYSFTNLPKYENNGNVIRYSVQEGAVAAGYQSEVHGTDIINRYTPGKIAIQVAKSWADNNNQDGIRPNSVTVHLLADGKDTGKKVLLNAGNNWIADFKDLDEYQAGKKVTYTVTEDTVEKYTTVITYGADEKHFTITNTHTPEVTKVEGTKIWNDANDQDGKRPTSVEVLLKKGGQEIARQTVSAKTNWIYSFTNLPKYENNGAEIRYTVQEGTVPAGYQSSVKGHDITNTYTPGKVAVQVAKSWIDNNNQDNIRPASVTVHLYANGIDTGKKLVLSAENNWIGEFADLNEKAAGKTIKYTITEDSVKGYTKTITQGADEKHFTVTNTHTPEVTSVEGTKSWNDANDKAGLRPESVEIILKKGGQEIDRKTVTKENDWKYSFTNLPKFERGAEIRYSVEEANVPEGYQSSIDGYDIMNSYTPGKIAVQVAKSWQDDRNLEGVRPKKIRVWLYENGVETDKYVDLNAGNNWTANFSDLDEIKDGKKVEYTVREEAVKEYETTYETSQGGKHVTITNTHTPERVEVSVEKQWDDKDNAYGYRPENVKLILYQEYEGEIYPVTYAYVSAAEGWKYTFENLPKYVYDFEKGTFAYDEDGNKEVVKYTVREHADDLPEGYAADPEVIENTTDDYTIINKVDTKKVKFSKTDLGGNELSGAEITVSGTDTAGKEIEESWTSGGIARELELPQGTYTMKETSAPRGYEIATEIEFTVNADGTITVNDVTTESEDENVVTMVDDFVLRKVKFSKTDIAGEELEGAKIRVTGKNAAGQDITEFMKEEDINWTSNGTAKELELPMGTYAMEEIAAPKGYEIATKIAFTVNSNGTITVKGVETGSENNNVVTMVDGYKDQTVTISKTDITGSEELEGAELVVKDLTGKTIEEWTSKADGGHKITLQPGIYVLSETTAPKGYKVTESIMFKVDLLGETTIVKQTEENGVVSYEEVETVDKVIMKDDYADGKVIISKTDVAGNEIEGAKLEITDKDGKVVKEWTSEAGKNKEVELYPGTYTLTEKTAPKGYEIAESITFTVDKDSNVTVEGKEVGKVTMVDEYSEHTVKFSKTDIKGKELKGAEIKLTDKDGNVIEKWKSDGKVKEFSLKPGTYTFTETAAPKGYKIASAITFEVGIDGTITSKDVELKGSDKNLIVMVDDYAKKTTTNKSQSKNTIRTGDAVNVTTWLLMLVISFISLIVIIKRKKLNR